MEFRSIIEKKGMTSRNLVLGANGFLGQHLVEAFIKRGEKAKAYVSLKSSRAKPSFEGVEWIYGDFVSEQRWLQILDGVEICYHLISTTSPKRSNEDPIFDVDSNIIGTLRLLEAAKQTCTKIIFASSGGTIYGNSKGLLTETDQTHPLNSYGITKLSIEKYLSLYKTLYDLKSISLRISNPYGMYQSSQAGQGAATIFLNKVLRGEPIDIWGDGTVVRDYIYVSDVIEAMLASSIYDGDTQIFNIGSGVGVSLLDLISEIEYTTQKSAKINYFPARKFDVLKNVLNIDLACSKLRWKPSVSLKEGLQITECWLKQHNKY
ncbi:MAG: NAD-dependent epimerase/dehydratase family protein [Gammaproteobacteria bacterium]|nr:MAG: NAD-dependent epimerase/dehydratase family protein [Gammaproteobacteria bacterium]